MDLQARYNRLKEQNRMLIEEARRYEKQIEELQSKISKLAELNQKAFEVNIELSHKLLTYLRQARSSQTLTSKRGEK